MIPKELLKPLDGIKQPGAKGWIASLIIAVMFLTSWLMWKDKKDGSDCDQTKEENKRLNNYIIEQQDKRIERLEDKKQMFDSVNNKIKTP